MTGILQQLFHQVVAIVQKVGPVEVVQALGKLRPISQEAGLALEAALNDAVWRVRWQARQTLLGYRLSGYKSPPKPEEAPPAVAASGKPTTNTVPTATPAKSSWFSKPAKHGVEIPQVRFIGAYVLRGDDYIEVDAQALVRPRK